MIQLVNDQTAALKTYPMEQLREISDELKKKGQTVYDFGTGDPRLPVSQDISRALVDSITDDSSYPSISGIFELLDAQYGYLERRFQIVKDENLSILPTRGSKEAIFHIALSLVGRSGGKR